MKPDAICMIWRLKDSRVSGNPKGLLGNKFPKYTRKGKVMLEVFFDSHYEFIPQGRTVTRILQGNSSSPQGHSEKEMSG